MNCQVIMEMRHSAAKRATPMMKFRMETRQGDRTRTDAARYRTLEYKQLRRQKRERMEVK